MIGVCAARRHLLTVLGVVGLASACKDGVEPVIVASVEVTSPIGALLDVGGNATLSAAAKDRAGESVSGISFTWTSSNPAVVSITAAGSIEALAIGTATIRAEAGSAAGSLALRVVDADLAGITALATDPFVVVLVGAPSADVRARLQAAVGDCTAGTSQGNLEAIQDCIAAVRAEVTGATDPSDRALLAVLALFVDQIERLLNL